MVIVLGEDAHHQRFVRHFLYQVGFQKHDLRFEPISGGKGSAEQWVRERYPRSVKAFRARSAKARTALVVAIDVDPNSDVQRRVKQLDDSLQAATMPGRAPGEQIVHLIPKLNIETWIVCLNGQPVDEETDYRRDSGIDSMIVPASAAFFACTRLNVAVPAHCVDSLRLGIIEAQRLSTP